MLFLYKIADRIVHRFLYEPTNGVASGGRLTDVGIIASSKASTALLKLSLALSRA